jgi:hypothetical protein
MTAPRRKREIFANPFFAILLLASVVFVLTVLAYLSSAWVLDREPGGPPRNPRSVAVAQWLDGNAPLVLGGEIVVMLGTGVLAMVFDPWFSARTKSKPPE